MIAHHFNGSGGLVDSLRPYTGRIDREALADVLAAVRALRSGAEDGEAVPISVVAGVFYVTHTVRRWALDKDSMLVRNNRINISDWQILMDWVVEVEVEYRALLGVLEEREEGRRS